MVIRICNLQRLRRVAIRYGVAYESMELDPATVNGLIDVAEKAKKIVDSHPGSLLGDFDAGMDELRDALSVFDFEDR